MAVPAPRPGKPSRAPSRRKRSAAGLLADDASRAVLLALGEPPPDGDAGWAITEQPLPGLTPRVIRERLRDLERSGLAEIVERGPANGGAPSLWGLTTAGRDLFRLQALIARIVARASEPKAVARRTAEERAIGQTVGWFADPVTVQILRALAIAGEPLGPVSLEQAVDPVPRRTLYRRLTPLLDEGAVVRITGHTVPRSTWYELGDRWRPAAAIPVLCTWWESRHWTDEGPSTTFDPEGVIHTIAPLVRLDRKRPARDVRLGFGGPATQRSLVLRVSGDRISTGVSSDAPDVDATASGGDTAWAAALVTDGSGRLQLDGDADLARAVIIAIRAALLTYVR